MDSIYYTDQGTGPALVLLHGFCETHEIWEQVVPELSKRFRVISVDLPGFGKSKILRPGFTVRDVAQAISTLLAEIEIKQCLLIGHSLGGYVALSIASDNPDVVHGLCLFHSTALPDSNEKKINRDRVIEFVEKNGVGPYLQTFVPSLFFQKEPKKLERTFKIASGTSKNAILGYSAAMRERPDMTGFLAKFSKPLLFLAGEKDSFITVSSVTEQAKIAADGKVKVLPETGHLGMFENPDESIRILKDFGAYCFQRTPG